MKIEERTFLFPNGEQAIIRSARPEDNERARHLYTKNGFKEYGINPRAFKLKDGTYCDEIIMATIFC